MEINPQTINPEYQISALDPCPGISRPQYYQSVYSCSGFPIEPYQQLYPFQSGTALILNQTDNYEVEVIAGGDYAYFERVEHTDSAGNFYPYETFGTLLTGLIGAELSGTGSFIGYEGTGTFERENSSVYRVRFNNYTIPEASVTIRIKNLNNNTFTDWHTLIVNPELQFTDQQNADTLLHYYSTDVTPVLRNVNFPCPHPGYGGCPPEDVTFNIEITEGQQYGSIKKELTGEVSTSFTGIPFNELYQFTYYANGVQPDSTATVRILHSSSDAELIPIEYEYTVKRNTVPPPSEGGSIYVKMDKKVVIPGDTINVQLRWIDEVGDTIDFLPMQRFRVDLAEGSEYGTILDILTADTSDTFTEITNEFKVIVNPQIEQQQAKIILVAEADLMIFTRPVRINNGTKTAKQIQESKVDKNDEQGGSNTDFIIIGNHLVGVGEITITKTPFVVEIMPPVLSAGDTAQIIPMKLNPDGTTTPFDSLQTFELGMLDGCMLGKLSNAGIDTNYFYGVAQPFYFIADSSADSGSVNIRVGVIEMNPQNRSLTSNNQLQPDNFVTYCFLNTYQTELFVDENVVVKQDEWCEDLDECDEIKFPDIELEVHENNWQNLNVCTDPTFLAGTTFLTSDNSYYREDFDIELCKEESSNKVQFIFDDDIVINCVSDFCEANVEADDVLLNDAYSFPNGVTCNDKIYWLEKHKIYPMPVGNLIHPGGVINSVYVIRDIWMRHEAFHRDHFQEVAEGFKAAYLIKIKETIKQCSEFGSEEDALSDFKTAAEKIIKQFYDEVKKEDDRISSGDDDGDDIMAFERRIHQRVKDDYLQDIIDYWKLSNCGQRF